MIPMLTRLDQELAQCADPLRRAELQAERASYLARTGHFAEANEILSMLRKAYGDGRHARVSVWIMFVEGLVLYFERMDPSARDRVLRANLISEAMRFEEMSLLTVSWLVHFDFNNSNYDAMLAHMRRWRHSSGSLSGASGLRISLVVADALSYCGDAKQARIWYEKTRQLCLDLCDEATLAAMIYNKAALGLNRLRVMSIDGPLDPYLIKLVSMEISSAINFHIGAGHGALAQLLEVCAARILLIQGRYSEALPKLESFTKCQGRPLGLKSDRLLLQIEHCECLVRLSNTAEAKTILEGISVLDYTAMTIDDQLVFLCDYFRLTGELGVSCTIVDCSAVIDRCRVTMEETLTHLRQNLLEIFTELI